MNKPKQHEIIGYLMAEKDDAEGEVFLKSWWMLKEGTLAKLDILKDCIGLLQQEYDKVYKEWGKEND